VFLALAAAAAGCSKSKGAASGSSGGSGAGPGSAAPGAGPAEGREFRVEARHEEAAKVGEATTAVISVTGLAPWKVNVEYPAKLEIVAAEGFTAPASPLRKDAAARLDESELRFELPLVPVEAGERAVVLKVKFGLCNADRCITRESVQRWSYAVGGG
jgi:hypothetical protein